MLRKVIIGLILVSAAPIFAPWFLDRVAALPLGFYLVYLMRLAPPLLIVLALWMGAARLAKVNMYLPFVGGAGLLALFVAYPTLANKVVDLRAAELASGDQRRFNRPPKFGTLAVLRQQDARCDGVCQRLLLGEQAERLLYVTVRDPGLSPVMGLAAVSYRMERRPSCPSVDLDADDPMAEELAMDKGAKPLERMRQAISGGRCLIVEKAALGEAEVVLFQRTMPNDQASALAAIPGMGDDMVQGERLSMYQRDGNMFRESYRRTVVSVEKLAPVTSWPYGLGSSSITRRYSQVYYDGPRLSVFIGEMLGLDLALKDRP